MLRFLVPAFSVTAALLVLFAGDIGDRLGPIGVSERSNPFANRTARQSDQLQKSEEQPTPRAAAQVALQHQTEPLQQKVDELQQQASTLQQQLAESSQALKSRTGELEQRTRELHSAQAEAVSLKQETDFLREQRRSVDTKASN